MRRIILGIITVLNLGCSAQEKKEIYFENGDTKRTYSLNSNGNIDGEDISYYLNGKIKSKTFWKNGILRDSITLYDLKGNLKSIGRILNDSLVFYRIDGSKEFYVPILNGKQNGQGIYFDNDENINGFVQFNDGLKSGNSLLLNQETLTPKFISNYIDGELGSLLIDFYDNGKIKSFRTKNEISFKGQVINFHENGVIKSIVNTVNNKADGWKLFFNSNGQLLEKKKYKSGQEVK